MVNYKEFFKNKKITVMGLGILGRGLGYTKFLADCGADLIVTDLKTREQLATSIKELDNFKNIKFILGEHKLEDFRNRDMIIKNPGVPPDSIYVAEARNNNIPVEMDVSLLIKYAPEIKVIGVTGTRGKSMTTVLIYEILKHNKKLLKHPSTVLRTKKLKVFLGGNMRGVATLPLLKKIKEGDILVCELDSWQLQGFGESKISPNISVFTSFMSDHMNYYKNDMEAYFADKANIFKNQTSTDFLVIRPGMEEFIKEDDIKGTLFVANKHNVENWKFKVPGEHQRENLACAVVVAEIFGIPKDKIKKVVEKFKGVEGRLQYVKTAKGVKIYNDNNATTPEATIAGIEALKNGSKNIILICGGADKNLDLVNLVNAINKHCKVVVLIPGTGTEKLVSGDRVLVASKNTGNLNDAVKEAMKQSKKGDIILFSPAFASFGMFNNEYERNDQFMKIVKSL